MKKKLLAMLVGTSLVLAACGGGGDEAAEPTEPAEPADTGGAGETTTVNAEEIYQQSCIGCHGQDLSGGVGPDLRAVGSKYSQEEIEGIIEQGKGIMQGGIIKGEEVTAVAEWLAAKK